uniref:EGF-like domain-containing protein n=1 Tax=Caenorhabditis japonica TaxID=281687 RepID=A0A8R1EMG7_CAEJA
MAKKLFFQIPAVGGFAEFLNYSNLKDYDENCNIGEKHSTFLFAYAADFDAATFAKIKQTIVGSIGANRHNYTRLAAVRFDAKVQEEIAYFLDVGNFSQALDSNPPNSTLALDASNPSNILQIIKSFLSATGRPLESSMIVILGYRFPENNTDLRDEDYDLITNNNVKVFPLTLDTYYKEQYAKPGRSFQPFSNLASNSNGHYIVCDGPVYCNLRISDLMKVAYVDSLAFSRNLGAQFTTAQFTELTLGTLTVPKSFTHQLLTFTVTITVESLQSTPSFSSNIHLIFNQTGEASQYLRWENTQENTNYYSGSLQLKPGKECQIVWQAAVPPGSSALVRIWTPSAVYHYGTFAAITDPMGWVPIDSVDSYNGTALRMRLMNDCYSDYAGSIKITDCNGVVSPKYEAIQSIPVQYIFADEGSFPHYPFAPFFCDPAPFHDTRQCVKGAENKYDIQFVAGEFTVIRSFQCRPGKGVVDSNCQNVDANGNVYCDRATAPYKRGPTGQLTDCLGHGHLEFDFFDTQSYICVCDQGYNGASCEKSG